MKLDATMRTSVTRLLPVLLIVGLHAGASFAAEDDPAKKVTFDVATSACQRVQTTLKANGKLRTASSDEAQQTAIRVVGELEFVELLLTDAEAESPRSGRYYKQAQAKISVGERVDESQLDDARRLMVVQRSEDGLTYFSPQGPLTRGDLELISSQCDPLAVRELLDGETLAVKDSWQPNNRVLAELFGIDHITNAKVKCQLLSATKELARVQITGEAEGVALGAMSKLKVDGTITVDRKRQAISRIAVTINEQRDVGLFAPGFEMEAHIDTKISPTKTPPELDRDALAQVAAEPESADMALAFGSPNLGVAFIHDRQWRVTLHRRDLLVLRLVRDGKFVAQCNMTPATDADDDHQADKTRFQAHVEQALAENNGQLQEISTAKREDGLQMVRISASGKANELPITWVYYMLADPSGQRLALVFTYATAQEKHFNSADLDLIGNMKLVDDDRAAQHQAAGSETR